MPLFNIEKISKALLPPSKVRLFSDITDKTICDCVKKRLSECSAQWNGYVHADYGDLYGEFSRNRNRCNFEDLYINRRREIIDLTLDVDGLTDSRLKRLEQLITTVCNEDTWCVPAHAGIKPQGYEGQVIELYAAETAAALSVAYSFLKNRLSAETLVLISRRVNERMFTPYLVDGYKWMGIDGKKVNNWNPWINSNVMLCAAILLGENEELYRRLVLRACSLTENYINSLSDDCTCDEGVRYWHLSGACLFDVAEILYDLTGGKIDLTASEQVKSACDYIVAMYDSYGLPANFADASIDFYPDCALLMRIGERTGNKHTYALGRSLFSIDNLRSLHDNFYRQIKNLYTVSRAYENSYLPFTEEMPQLPEATLLRGINVAVMRKNGFYLAFKGGHNGESHNHNDLGSFVLYRSGAPLFIDPGVELYSGYTFSPDRTKLWYMRSDYHNLPVIGGKIQEFGSQYKAGVTLDGMHAETDISRAYKGIEGVYKRSADLSGDTIMIKDEFTFAPSEILLYYMMKEKPVISENTLVFADGTTAVFEGIAELALESIDLTGRFPPDGIKGDYPNRHPAENSVLIPRLLTKQWRKTELYRLVALPCSKTVTLTFK